MTTDNKPAAEAFLQAHSKLREIAAKLAPDEAKYLSMDGLGRAGMEVAGVLDDYTKKSEERNEVVAEMRRLRAEVGDDNLLAELKKIDGGGPAVEYIQKVPLRGQKEPSKEPRRSIFGKWR